LPFGQIMYKEPIKIEPTQKLVINCVIHLHFPLLLKEIL
jgi:hypothetical protein